MFTDVAGKAVIAHSTSQVGILHCIRFADGLLSFVEEEADRKGAFDLILHEGVA